ncbi:MAG: alpha/beta fold hydrolase [Saprospiraceae bacterium]|nr:alpha/beta fold hydrolase [Lewinella sp.]
MKDPSTIKFGYLTVPENHAFPEGRKLQIAFTVLQARSSRSLPDPVLYISGGPGIGALQDIPKWEDHFLRKERDIILVDFRGIGYSEPEMCSDLNEILWSLFAGNYVSPEIEKETKVFWFQDCFTGLRSRGIDLEQYRSAAVVRDLEILREYLGYNQWNLLSVSYGTRMAQTYLRDAPEHLRSIILDSTFPLGYYMDHPLQGYLRSLTSFFELCENDPVCKARFGGIQPRFYEVMDSIKARSIALYPPAFPNEMFLVNAQDAHLMFFQFLKNRDNYPALPYLIEAIADRNAEIFDNMITLAKGQNDRVSLAAGVLINKNDNYYPPVNPATRKDPLKDALTYFDGEYEVLRSMDELVTYDSLERQPVSGKVPTLILAGDLDPATPPEYGQEVHEGLPNSYYLLFPGLSHGVSRAGGCIPDLITDFLRAPEKMPEMRCPEEWPASTIPFTGDLYENSRIGTLLRQLVVEKRIVLFSPLVLLLLGWIVAIVKLFRKRKLIFTAEKRYQLISFLTHTLGMALVVSTVWLIHQTIQISQLLVLFGLTGVAHYFYYATYLFLAAILASSYYWVRGIRDHTGLISWLISGLSVLTLIPFACLLFVFNLFPN